MGAGPQKLEPWRNVRCRPLRAPVSNKARRLRLRRVMKKSGLKVGETHCFALLRLCFNRIRALWYPGGYPPTKDHAHMVPGFRCAPRPAGPMLGALKPVQ